MHKFWNFTEDDSGRTLRIEGQIADETWFGDEVTPQVFKNDLHAGNGDITLWINSPGGDVFAAAQIYNMLMDYKGDVHVVIDGLAASAASVIAMAGTTVSMSPVAMMMIHNPATVIFGEAGDLASGIKMLTEVKESIVNAYEERTGLSRSKISNMMDAETWFSAKKAVELGFADKILYAPEETSDVAEGFIFDRVTVTNSFLRKLPKETVKVEATIVGTSHQELMKRLELLK